MLALAAAGEPAQVEGRVLEYGSARPAPGIVRVEGEEVEVDEDGGFSLELPPGHHVLHFEGDDHRPVQVDVELEPGEVSQVRLRAERYTWDDPIMVYRQREDSSRVVQSQELSRVPGAFGDPVRALQSLPGVARPSSLEGAVVVRGAEAMSTATTIDDIPIPFLFHMLVGRSVVSPAILDEVEFFPGGMSPRYGNVSQAVVNVRTVGPPEEGRWRGRVSFDLMDLAGSVEGQIAPDLSLQAGWRMSWIGAVVGAGVRTWAWTRGLGGEVPPYPVLEYHDGLARLTWEQGRDRVTVGWLGASDALRIHPGSAEDELETDLPYDPLRILEMDFHRFHLRWDREGEGRRQTWSLAAGPERQQSVFRGVGFLMPGLDFGRVQGWSAFLRRNERIEFDSGTLETGQDFSWQPSRIQDFGQLEPDMSLPEVHDIRVSSAVWGEWQGRLGALRISPGLRAGVHAFADELELQPEPRLKLGYPVGERFMAKGFVGRFTQIPPSYVLASPTREPLGSIRTWQVSAGLEGRWPTGLEADATLYASRSQGLPIRETRVEVVQELSSDPFLPGGAMLSPFAHDEVIPGWRSSTGYATGLELLLRQRPRDGWFGWVALTLGHAWRVTADGTMPADYDLPLSLVAVGAYELPWELVVSGKVQVTTGYPFTPMHPVYDVASDAWQGFPGAPNADRLPWFRQLDVRLERTWTRPRSRLTVYLDVHNALNTRNPFLATYNQNYQTLRSEIFLPIVPNLGLEVRY